MMEESKLRELYKAFLETAKCNEEAMKIDLDLTWLEEKLGKKEILRLEEVISDYAAQYQEFMFKNGFMCAWELFSQCNKAE